VEWDLQHDYINGCARQDFRTVKKNSCKANSTPEINLGATKRLSEAWGIFCPPPIQVEKLREEKSTQNGCNTLRPIGTIMQKWDRMAKNEPIWFIPSLLNTRDSVLPFTHPTGVITGFRVWKTSTPVPHDQDFTGKTGHQEPQGGPFHTKSMANPWGYMGTAVL